MTARRIITIEITPDTTLEAGTVNNPDAVYLDLLPVIPLIVGGGGAYGQTWQQPVAAALWTIPHNLGFRPAVQLFTPGGALMIADVTHLDANTLTVAFVQPTSGYARIV